MIGYKFGCIKYPNYIIRVIIYLEIDQENIIKHHEIIDDFNATHYCNKAKVIKIIDKNNKEYDEKKLNRMIYKNKKLNIGLIADEISDIFENMTDKEKLMNLDDDNINDYNELIKDKKPTINDDEYLKEKNNKPHTSINYNVVCCYLIKCFHEQITINEKLEDENKLLKDKIKEIDDKFNKLLNKLNLTI